MSQVRTTHVTLRTVLVCLLVLLPGSPAAADQVTPSDRVTNFVNVRQGPSTDTAQVGELRPGETAELLGSVPWWNEVRLEDGTRGFVSKSWTEVVPEGSAPSYTLHAVDVATGLAVLVTGEDFALLYDGGSNDDLARGTENRLVAYLDAATPQLTKLDHLIVSHPHRDHVELLPDILDRYEVENVWDSGAVNPICGYRAFLTAVRDEPGVQYHAAIQDFGTRTISFDAKRCYGEDLPAEDVVLNHDSRINEMPIPLGRGASMTILHADGSSHPSFNENSVVVRLDLGEARVLFMGDAEAGGRESPTNPPHTDSIEGALLACCVSELPSDLLIIGHHGSKTSSRTAFLDAVGADTFVVSSGPVKYGSVVLPDQEVIDVLAARGTVFRTDLNDSSCGQNAAKIGPDADGKAGGCDNVQVTIDGSGAITTDYWRGSD